MTASALELDPEKGGGHDVPLRREGRIVFRRLGKASAASVGGVSTHHEQFRDHAVERFVVAQRIVEKPAERPSAVERGIDQRGVLREGVQPDAHLMIRPAFIGQQPVDDLAALVRVGVREKCPNLIGSRRQADGVEINAAKKCRIGGEGRLGEPGGIHGRRWPCGTVANP